ncbi:hypothetical protein [Lacticaseibacillus yichunensis]|uniref:NfeD-like C-terminal domain-containing protein n=1 Tax=Lacticaseibacillus yichunensis TaxID=2486015 RepID=A0ABW4CRX5_9LACO|nr:hypothetical protein [Lacticaseibacillus yichunensis]
MVDWFTALPLWGQIGVGLLVLAAFIAVIWMLLSLVLLPVIALIQKALEPSENSTVMPDQDYLLGTLTLGLDGVHTGEVMITGGGRARQTYPAKPYESQTTPLAKGAQVVIIEVKQGTAYVKALVLPGA